MAGKGMRGWSQVDEGNDILCRRNSTYEALRWEQLAMFPEQYERQRLEHNEGGRWAGAGGWECTGHCTKLGFYSSKLVVRSCCEFKQRFVFIGVMVSKADLMAVWIGV